MTMVQAVSLVGTQVGYHINGLAVPVRIVDVKASWGKFRFDITPVGGAGRVWVEVESLTLGA